MRTSTGAVGIVIHKGNILLIYREKFGKKYFMFPGGGIEDGENAEQAVVRELAEETSIIIRPIRQVYHIKYDDGTDRLYFLCEYVSGTPKLQENTNEYEQIVKGEQYYEPKWLPISDLNSTLVYPLQVRDWVCKDVEDDFDVPIRDLYIDRTKERQL